MNETISAVQQVAALKPGESFAKTRFIPAGTLNTDDIPRAKQALLRTTASIVARAQERQPHHSYRTYSIHAFTRDYDVIVAAVIVRSTLL